MGRREQSFFEVVSWSFASDIGTRFNSRQPILADEVQTFKALITIHKVLQEGHPIAVKEAQSNTTWLETLTRGVSGDGIRGERGPRARVLEHWLSFA